MLRKKTHSVLKTLPVRLKSGFILRPFALGDATELKNTILKNEMHLKEHLGWLTSNYTDLDALDYIEKCIQGYSSGTSMNLAMTDDNSILGVIGYHTLQHNPDKNYSIGKLGYWIDKDSTGKGIVTESVRLILNIGFIDLSLEEVLLCAGTTNIKSGNIARRLGFTYNGIEKDAENLYGKSVDHHVFQYLKNDWLEQNK